MGHTGLPGANGLPGAVGQDSTVTGYTGPTGPQGLIGPVASFVFDGGYPSLDFSIGPTFNCGGVTGPSP
jgi:hypothetical protein